VTQSELHEASDHLHGNLGINEDGHLEPTIGPDWDELDRRIFGNEPEEEVVSWSHMVRALKLILE
jgi:hypothetical protein